MVWVSRSKVPKCLSAITAPEAAGPRRVAGAPAGYILASCYDGCGGTRTAGHGVLIGLRRPSSRGLLYILVLTQFYGLHPSKQSYPKAFTNPPLRPIQLKRVSLPEGLLNGGGKWNRCRLKLKRVINTIEQLIGCVTAKCTYSYSAKQAC